MKLNEKECLSASRRFQAQANKTCFNSKMSLLFEDIVEDYYSHAYGEDWKEVLAYMENIRDAFEFRYN